MNIKEELTKASELFDYIKETYPERDVNKLLTHLGFDNPHILKMSTLEEAKKTVDKFIQLNNFVRGKINE